MLTVASLLPYPGFVIPSYDDFIAPSRSPHGGSRSWLVEDADLPPGLRTGGGMHLVTALTQPFGTRTKVASATSPRLPISETAVREIVAFGRHFPPDPAQRVGSALPAGVFFAFLDGRFGVTNLDVRRAFLMGGHDGR